MGKSWTRLMAVFVVFAVLQGRVFIGLAFGEAWMPESRGTTETAVTGAKEITESSAASEQEATPSEMTDGTRRQSSYVFKPKVCSTYIEEIFGKTMCETWFHLVDAVLAGEDTFACPDQHTYDWVMGQFPIRCFPVLTELIDYAYDRENSVVDGIASFTYRIPREEAARQIGEFEQQVEGILNDAFEDDYSDFEKVLALYEYFSQHYQYHYETEQKTYVAFVDYTTTYRLFKEGMGICSEIARAFAYLLMQAGVDAATVMGGGHEWSLVRINGVNYHVDPTFALDTGCSLAYFMMTDEQREATGYGRDSFVFISNYSQDHPHADYPADDDTFGPLWERRPETFYPQENFLRCWKYSDIGEMDYLDFDYTGY